MIWLSKVTYMYLIIKIFHVLEYIFSDNDGNSYHKIYLKCVYNIQNINNYLLNKVVRENFHVFFQI